MGHVPMTRPEEVLAVHEWNYGHSVTFAELEDRRVLLCGGWEFRISEDWGLTWSEPFRCTDIDGNPVGGSGPSLVRLSGQGLPTWALQDVLLRTSTGRIIGRLKAAGEGPGPPPVSGTRSM